MCGICRVTLRLRHRAVRFPWEQGRHVLHVSHVVEDLARVAALAPLRCPAASCTRG